MAVLLGLIFGAPALAVIVCLTSRIARIAEYANLLSALAVFGAAVPLMLIVSRGGFWRWKGLLLLDDLGAWVILCVAIVYLLSSIYAVGYMRLLGEDSRLPVFYALFSGFALSMLVASVMDNVGVFWIAIELTTLVSTFLVGFEREAESTEAAWKYLVVVSAGISLALLGTVLYYWGGTRMLGPEYEFTWSSLRQAAPKIPPPLATVAFLLVLVGYGTKAGLVPMHTWLPDAHSESPAPVSALLSGALLNTAMMGIARFLGIMNFTSVGQVAHEAMVALGILSFIVATLFISRQTGVKRLMAYSSVEHLGVQAIALGFGGYLGIAGALYHMLNHSLNKSLMFFGAGNAMRAFNTKEMGRIRNVLSAFPVTGVLWLAGAVAISGAPPFGLFQSEFTILRAGLRGSMSWVVFVFAIFVIVVFISFMAHFRRMYFGRSAVSATPAKEGALWRAVPMWLSIVPLLLFGLWWPTGFWTEFGKIAVQLGAALK